MTDKTIEALAELVAIEDLKKSLAQANHHAARYPTDENYAVIDSLSTELARRRPLAWDAARAALSAPVEPVALPAGWEIETGRAGFTDEAWLCVRNTRTQCGQDFYADRDPLIFGFMADLAKQHGITPPAATNQTGEKP